MPNSLLCDFYKMESTVYSAGTIGFNIYGVNCHYIDNLDLNIHYYEMLNSIVNHVVVNVLYDGQILVVLPSDDPYSRFALPHRTRQYIPDEITWHFRDIVAGLL